MLIPPREFSIIHYEKNLKTVYGVLTSNVVSGEQWDAMNLWAPLQYIAFRSLKMAGYDN